MTASSSSSTRRRVATDRIAIPGNVRDLDSEHVDALAKSIKLRGLLVPVIVRPVGEDFELVAGFHRFAAHRQLGMEYIDADVRDVEDEHGDRAIENIASCRRRHEAIYADRVAMPMSEVKCPTVGCEPGGEVGIRPRTDPGSQAAQTIG